MEFEESLTFDFQVKSLMALIDRLEELNAALNIPSTFYKVATRHIHAVSQQPLLTGLLPKEKLTEVLLVVGNKCAGKTTLSDYLASREGVVAVEASKVLRSLAWEAEETIDTAIGAVEFLEKHGMDCVAKKIAEYVDMRKGVLNVITGLRTVEELYLLKMHFPQAKLVLVSSDVRIRFERHIRRARDPDVKAFADFIAQDEIQATFGVMRVANEIATDVIANDASISQFENKIDELLDGGDGNRGRSGSMSELHRCLRALRSIGHAATCDAISEESAKFGVQVRRYNTNRALKSVPEFAVRIDPLGSLLKYRITPKGQYLLNLLDLIHPAM